MHALTRTFAVTPIVLMALGLGASLHASQDPAASLAFYTARVKPIFDENCAKCHEGVNKRGGFNMDTRESMLAGGHHGAAVVPGDPDKSLLVKLMRHEGPADDPMDMPPHHDKLPDAEIAIVAQWVKAGAVMPPAVPAQ